MSHFILIASGLTSLRAYVREQLHLDPPCVRSPDSDVEEHYRVVGVGLTQVPLNVISHFSPTCCECLVIEEGELVCSSRSNDRREGAWSSRGASENRTLASDVKGWENCAPCTVASQDAESGQPPFVKLVLGGDRNTGTQLATNFDADKKLASRRKVARIRFALWGHAWLLGRFLTS